MPPLDLSELGAPRDQQPQRSDRRLYVALTVIECPRSPGTEAVTDVLAGLLQERGVGAVVYADLHHPLSIGVLVWTEQPEVLSGPVREALAHERLPSEARIRPEFSMLGRTYSSGFEPDLEDWLLARPRRTLLEPKHVWSIRYPLRRKGTFARLEGQEQGEVMKEHGRIGRAYGEQDLAHDIRLARYGLDTADNDFVIGLVGKDLHPLSHVVQSMRRTRQTAEFIEEMGPFFVGRVLRRWPEASTL